MLPTVVENSRYAGGGVRQWRGHSCLRAETHLGAELPSCFSRRLYNPTTVRSEPGPGAGIRLVIRAPYPGRLRRYRAGKTPQVLLRKETSLRVGVAFASTRRLVSSGSIAKLRICPSVATTNQDDQSRRASALFLFVASCLSNQSALAGKPFAIR